MPEGSLYQLQTLDGAVYGPASVEMLRQWAREGRVLAHMKVAPYGTQQWQPAGGVPELRDLFMAAPSPPAPAAPVAAPTSQGTPSTGVTYAPTPQLSAQNPSSGLAMASLICSLAGVFCTPFITSVVAIVLGFIALAQIRQAPHLYAGRGMALTGVILGFFGVLVITPAWMVAWYMLSVRHAMP